MAIQKHIKLSIIVPTIGRTKELEMLLASIQEAKLSFDYEILLIDQNPVGFLSHLISHFSILPIKHINVEFKGLSKAKNYGLKEALGQYVCFPDDDCKVFSNTFTFAFQILENTGADLVFGKCLDAEGKDSVLNFKTTAGFLDSDNMLGGFVEATVVAKKEVFNHYKFDETMGAGAFFGAEEGFDWLYRILTQSSYKAYYSPEIKFYHPQVILSKGDYASINRVFKYSCGAAYLCVKHRFYKRYYKRLLMTTVATMVYRFVNTGKYHYYKSETLGLLTGKLFAEKI